MARLNSSCLASALLCLASAASKPQKGGGLWPPPQRGAGAFGGRPSAPTAMDGSDAISRGGKGVNSRSTKNDKTRTHAYRRVLQVPTYLKSSHAYAARPIDGLGDTAASLPRCQFTCASRATASSHVLIRGYRHCSRPAAWKDTRLDSQVHGLPWTRLSDVIPRRGN